jgi:hypothetical protein
MKFAVHQAKPVGTGCPPAFVQKSESSHVPGPSPTGGRSTPVGVVGAVLLVGALPLEYMQALEAAELFFEPDLIRPMRRAAASDKPLGPAATTRLYTRSVNQRGARVEIGIALTEPRVGAALGAGWGVVAPGLPAMRDSPTSDGTATLYNRTPLPM